MVTTIIKPIFIFAICASCILKVAIADTYQLTETLPNQLGGKDVISITFNGTPSGGNDVINLANVSVSVDGNSIYPNSIWTVTYPDYNVSTTPTVSYNGLDNNFSFWTGTGTPQTGYSQYAYIYDSAAYWTALNNQSYTQTLFQGPIPGTWADIGPAQGSPVTVANYSLIDTSSPVPVPSAIWMFLTGLFGLLGLKRRKQ